jgi:pimeloyl-ACP methyl ester carboxylesterase
MTKVRRLDAGGVDIEVLEAGEGGRPFMLVHGFTGAKEDFADHLDALGEAGWHAVAPDLRGHGQSAHPAGTDAYSFAAFAADVTALADALVWDRYVLLGHSMGGMIAQHVALADPDRLVGLVLMDTGHGPVEGIDRDEVELGRSVVREGGMKLLVELQRDREGVLDTAAHQRVVRERPGYEAFGEAKMLASADDMWVAMVGELLEGEDRLERLRTLTVPTLVIVGDEDTPFIADSERMTKAIAGARLALLPDAGHSPQFENPDAWFAALTGFLAEVPA